MITNTEIIAVLDRLMERLNAERKEHADLAEHSARGGRISEGLDVMRRTAEIDGYIRHLKDLKSFIERGGI